MGTPPEPRVVLADGLDQVADVQRPVAVVAVELVPIAWEIDLALPLPQERGLPVSRVRGDHHGAGFSIRAQPIDKAGPAQRRCHVARRGDLVVDERISALELLHRRSRAGRVAEGGVARRLSRFALARADIVVGAGYRVITGDWRRTAQGARPNRLESRPGMRAFIGLGGNLPE